MTRRSPGQTRQRASRAPRPGRRGSSAVLRQEGAAARRPPPPASEDPVAAPRSAAARTVAGPDDLLAAIDVGSRALRLAVGELAPGRPVRRLEMLDAPVVIGLDTLSRNRIPAKTTAAVVRTLKDFLLVLQGYGIAPSAVRAVATTAVRDARNRDVFLDRVEQETGLRLEVIEAIEEMRLVYQYVRHLLGARLEASTTMLLSLGAGGTQIIVQRGGEIVFGETRHFGMLRLWRARPTERTAILAARSFLLKQVRAIERLCDLSEVRDLIVINKELSLFLERLAHPVHGEAGPEVDREELTRLHGALDSRTTEELVASTGLDHTATQMGRMALEELVAFARATSAATITIPATSLLDCLLLDGALARQGARGAEQLARQIESAAVALGRRYRFDEPHASHVRALALRLFDELQEVTHLAPRARLLLGVAAILHDIGTFVSPHAHERHSGYIIAASEIIGLTRADLERVALVARLHRRPFADLEGLGLASLPAADRVETLKLAALLRLADALDDDATQLVERVELEVAADVLRVRAATRSGEREGFASIAQSFRTKSDLFSDVFGLEPRLTEVLA